MWFYLLISKVVLFVNKVLHCVSHKKISVYPSYLLIKTSLIYPNN